MLFSCCHVLSVTNLCVLNLSFPVMFNIKIYIYFHPGYDLFC